MQGHTQLTEVLLVTYQANNTNQIWAWLETCSVINMQHYDTRNLVKQDSYQEVPVTIWKKKLTHVCQRAPPTPCTHDQRSHAWRIGPGIDAWVTFKSNLKHFQSNLQLMTLPYFQNPCFVTLLLKIMNILRCLQPHFPMTAVGQNCWLVKNDSQAL